MKNICPSYLGPRAWEVKPCGERSAATLRFPNRKSPKRIGTSLPLTPRAPSSAATREYFRSLRAAEMAAWEMTGGDCLRSCIVMQA